MSTCKGFSARSSRSSIHTHYLTGITRTWCQDELLGTSFPDRIDDSLVVLVDKVGIVHALGRCDCAWVGLVDDAKAEVFIMSSR